MATPNFTGAPAFLAYLNLEHGIRIDYPSNWILKEQSLPVSFAVAFGSPQEDPSDQYQENLSILLQPIFPGTTQDSFVQGWQNWAKQANPQVLEIGATTLANHNATRIVCNIPLPAPIPIPGKALLFLFIIGAIGYTVTYTGQQGHFEIFLPTVQHMLSTLQVH